MIVVVSVDVVDNVYVVVLIPSLWLLHHHFHHMMNNKSMNKLTGFQSIMTTNEGFWFDSEPSLSDEKGVPKGSPRF